MWNNLIHDLWENHATLQDIDSKHSSSRYFASSSNGLCARILALFFFPSKDLFQSTQFNGDKMFTKIKQLKNIGHRARSWAKDHCTSLPGPWTEKKQYRVLEMRARSLHRLRDFNAQYGTCGAKLRNHLKSFSSRAKFFCK